MKTILTTLFALTATLIASAEVTMVGRWQLEQDIQGNTATVSFELNQEGDRLWGSIKLSDSKNAPISGKVSGGKVTFQYPAEWEGQALTMVYTGAVGTEGELVGTVEVQPLGAGGDFKARRIGRK